MKVQRKIYLGSSLITIICLLLLLVIGYVTVELKNRSKPMLASEKLFVDVNELSLLTHEYITYGKRRIIDQWYTKLISAEALMNEAFTYHSNEKRMTQQSLQHLKELLERLIVNQAKSENEPEKKVFQLLRDKLVRQIMTEIRIVSSISSKISMEEMKLMESTQRKAFLTLLLLLLAIIIFITMYAQQISKALTSPFDKLIEGIEAISRGNFDYRIPIKSKDEFGVLAEHFNNMTHSLVELIDSHHQLSEEIDVRIKVEEALSAIATTDDLTKVHNRRSCIEMLTHEFATAKRYGNDFSVFILDIDNFKQINDNYGHDAGDEALINLCRIVSKTIRETDNLYRYGGDEFVVILPEACVETAKVLADRILEKVRDNILEIKGKRIKYSISIGAASYYPESESFEKLLKEADIALYSAKEKGKSCAVFHKPSLQFVG